MPVSKPRFVFIYFKSALSGLKFTRQNAEKCSSGYLSKQNVPGVHAPGPPSQTSRLRRTDL